MARHNCSWILRLEDESGQLITDTEEMMRIAVIYFGDLFTASDLGGDDRVLGLVEKKISMSMNKKFIQPLTKDDIWLAVKSMAPMKAPRTDGFPALFFQWCWNIVGDKVSNFVWRF